MKKILLGLMIIILASALVAGSTYAVFSDTEARAGRQFVAGTPDLKIDESTLASANIGVTSMKPGDNGAVSRKLTNIGTADGSSLTVDLTDLVDSPGITSKPEPTPDLGELSANMDMVFWVDDGAGGGVAGDGILNGTEATLYSGKLNLEAGPYNVAGGLSAGATTYIGISYSIASNVGDEIQGDSCTFDFEFALTQ